MSSNKTDTGSGQTPVVTDWKDDVEQSNSVIDFDRSEVSSYENKTLKECTIDEQCKFLIKLGEDTLNPALASGMKKIMRQLHGESLRSENPTRGRGNGSRGRGNGSRGRGNGSRGRGNGGRGRGNGGRGRGNTRGNSRPFPNSRSHDSDNGNNSSNLEDA